MASRSGPFKVGRKSGLNVAMLLILFLATSCSSAQETDLGLVASTVSTASTLRADTSTRSSTATPTPAVGTDTNTDTSSADAAGLPDVVERPAWLGQRTLPTTPDGVVLTPQTTPEELRDRRLATIDLLPAPTSDRFEASISPIPDDVLTRSTWNEGCPVTVDDLAYLVMTFWGFDDRPHTGEMIVNAAQAQNVVGVFEKLYDARFPVEEMRVVSTADLEADPTGDGNNTAGFVCRAVTGGSRFSEHAYGLAIDLNPFHNPYQRGNLILPELAAEYLDRSAGKPGTVVAGDVAVEAFAAIGWSWGGDWRSLKDYQHFALNNR